MSLIYSFLLGITEIKACIITVPVRGHDQGGPGRAPTVIWKSKPDPNRESDIGTKVAIPLKTDIDYRKVPEFMTSIRQLKLPVPVFSAEAYDKTLMIFLVRGAKAALNVFADAKLADYYRPLKHVSNWGTPVANPESLAKYVLNLTVHL